MEMDEKQKLTVLLGLLSERYEAAHKMRERSLKFTMWILGLAVALVWILISGTQFIVVQKWVLTALVFILGLSAIWFLRSLESGAAKNHKVMIGIEKALGCYDKGTYLESEALLPESYTRDYGKSWRSHFKTIYILVIPLALLIMLLIWVSPERKTGRQDHKANQHNSLQIEKGGPKK
ncbi:MAG: hypothetical protein CVU57_23455 [Deltaproteobacteria bacterium HGW-Deltaproteobacteria-15]|jgi:fatty acid desaturase|nr:MAG: hypothetical protein CVU57_23455 [Deltaproteobacteria bacterium HGW-Deltaproteobacteria-15]